MDKEAFLSRAPPFMGDILWAHLEILQKDVDKENAKVENVPNNFSEPFNVPDQFQRTYTTLGAPPPPPPISVPPPPPSTEALAPISSIPSTYMSTRFDYPVTCGPPSLLPTDTTQYGTYPAPSPPKTTQPRLPMYSQTYSDPAYMYHPAYQPESWMQMQPESFQPRLPMYSQTYSDPAYMYHP